MGQTPGPESAAAAPGNRSPHHADAPAEKEKPREGKTQGEQRFFI